MKPVPYLCLAGTEIANANRTMAYVRDLGDPRFEVPASSCFCEALEDEDLPNGYTSPDADDAPWYDPLVSESAEYFGMLITDLRMSSVASHDLNRSGGVGASLGAIGLAHRVLSFRALIFAETALGMAYGERWVSEALTGSFCQDGCADDELEILPACPDVTTEAALPYFRHFVNAGITDGPDFGQIDESVPDCLVQEVSFQFIAALPWLYAPGETCMDTDLASDDEECCLISTTQWGETTLKITITVDDVAGEDAVQGIRMYLKNTYDGECPSVSSVTPCWDVTINALNGGDILVIDGERRLVYLVDPSSKRRKAGFRYLQMEGMFTWPDVPPCTDMCFCIESSDASGGLHVEVETFARSI